MPLLPLAIYAHGLDRIHKRALYDDSFARDHFFNLFACCNSRCKLVILMLFRMPSIVGNIAGSGRHGAYVVILARQY